MSIVRDPWRQRLRRDAVQLILWIGGTAALAASGFAGVVTSYGGEQERVALLATVMANPVILLFRGLPSGAGESQMVVFLLLPWLGWAMLGIPLIAGLVITGIYWLDVRPQIKDILSNAQGGY